MATINSVDRPYFHVRLIIAAAGLVGFWICFSKIGFSQGKSLAGRTVQHQVGQEILTTDSSDAEEGLGIHEGATETPVVPPAPLPPNVPPVLMIDAGHGGVDGGTVGNGLLEKDWTLKVALALAEELKGRGHAVALTRETDQTIQVLDRPALVNAAPRIALISIHFNAGTSDATGVETWYSWPKKPEIMAQLHDAEGVPLEGILPDDGQQLASAIQQAVHAGTGARDRGIKNRVDLAMTSRVLCPAVLVECGFLSNGSESRKIQDNAYRKSLVKALANGYEAWVKSRSVRSKPTRPAEAEGTASGSPAAAPPVPSSTGPGAPAGQGDAEH